MTDIDKNQAKELLKGAQRILIAPSQPDGDSVGSSLALMSVLCKLGKDAVVVTSHELPDYLAFLPLTDQFQPGLPNSKDFVISLSTEQADIDHLKYEVESNKINIIVTPKNGSFNPRDVSFSGSTASFDLIVTVDTGDLVQLGTFYDDNKILFESVPLLSIDHHASNGRFGTHNFLNFKAASTTQMLTPIFQDLEQETGKELIDEDVATLLLVGIITDTGSFQHSNTSPDAFEVAAELLDRGARQQEIIKHIFKTKSLATLKLWGRVLSKIQYVPEDKLVYSTITLQDLADTGASPDDTGGIIDELMSNAPGSEVVMLLKEKEPGFIGGSLRAPGKKADVSVIAQRLGGGGHKKAAGFRIRDKSMDEALAMTKEVVKNYIHLSSEEEEVPKASGQLFPGLVARPQQSIPKTSAGGEDMLLQDFRRKQNPHDEKVKAFFQDADGQETVEDALKRIKDS